MGKRSCGIRYLDLGEECRRLYLKGATPISIATLKGENPQVISRSIWLAKIPGDIKELIRAHPEIFTSRILLNSFAAKRRQCEKDDFKLMRAEVKRLIELGAGSKPALKKTSKKKTKIAQKNTPSLKTSKLNPISRIRDTMDFEYRISHALGRMQTRVIFKEDGVGGEVRIAFSDDKSLEFIVERIEDLGQNKSHTDNTKKDLFLGFLD